MKNLISQCVQSLNNITYENFSYVVLFLKESTREESDKPVLAVKMLCCVKTRLFTGPSKCVSNPVSTDLVFRVPDVFVVNTVHGSVFAWRTKFMIDAGSPKLCMRKRFRPRNR